MAQPEQLDTRNRLLQAAASLMWERSFQSTGVDELCLRAEAKKGSFYHFFPSKTDLAIAAIERSWEQVKNDIFEPLFSTNSSGLTLLEMLVDKIYEFQLQIATDQGMIPGCPFGNLGQEMARQDERLRQTLETIFKGHCDYIEKALIQAEKDGEIPQGNNRKRAKNVFALMEGIQLLAKVTNDPQVLRSVKPAVLAVAAA